MTDPLIPALVLVPLASGVAAFMIRPDPPRRILLVAAAVAHAALTIFSGEASPAFSGWLALDAAGRLFLGIASALFLAAAVYGLGYLAREKALRPEGRRDFQENFLFTNAPEAVLTGCLLLFLATMSLVCVSRHLGLLWVAIEATTLASAPLIYFHRHRRSLEAAWRYLLICSIGIALALLGNFLLAAATKGASGDGLPLLLDGLLGQAERFQPLWLKAAFIFLLVGYGTKMGLAPLHTWLPDAHGEAPSLVSALLSGALLNCAFLGIFRAQQILAAAGEAAFGQELLTLFGLLSMGFAAARLVGQADYKRLLAYSSVEHMGIIALGLGLGGGAVFGALLHALNHSLAKAMLFFLSGNILAATRSKSILEVSGLTRLLPASGLMWLVGFLAITGSPPFGAFLSEFTILKAALDQGRVAIAVAYALILGLAFVALATVMLRMSQGRPPQPDEPGPRREDWLSLAPPAVLGALTLLLGLHVPPFLAQLLQNAGRLLGGGS